MKPEITPFPKQELAWNALQDKTTKYVGFGGGAGGGKSWIGAEWLMTNCYMYPGTKWFMGREELSLVMKSSYITFEKVCAYHKIPRTDWKRNGQYNFIKFKNGSRIDLLDLKFQPKDPLYQDLGSLEFTGGWIDEAGEINFGAFDTLKARIGRHLNKEYGFFPAKMLLTFNPVKNWLHQLFYKPWKDGTLPKEYVFIQSLYKDNPHTAEAYGESLKEIGDIATQQRLMYGNWDYEDNAKSLFKYESLVAVFSNPVVKTGQKYLIVDIGAGRNDSENKLIKKLVKDIKGPDKTVFSFWEDLEEYRREEFEDLKGEAIRCLSTRSESVNIHCTRRLR